MRHLISRLAAAAVLLPAVATQAAEPAQPTLQEMLAKAATIKEPVGAMVTFLLIDQCVRLKRGDALDDLPQTNAEFRAKLADCDGLTDELTAARMDYLDRALKSQAYGAATLFVTAGPDGDPAALKERPDDPQVVAWKKQAVGYLAESALQGDFSSMVQLQLQQFQPEKLGTPLPLIYAAHTAVTRILQKDMFDQAAPGQAEAALKQMSPEQRVAVDTMADSMVSAKLQRDQTPPAAAN